MALRLASTRSVCSTTTPRGRAVVVVTRANMVDDLGAGIIRIFTPLRTGNKEDWTGSENTGYKGSVDRMKKPFKDGWSGSARAPSKRKMEMKTVEPVVCDLSGKASVGESDTRVDDKNNVVSFLGGAAQNLIAHNFSGDATEPTQWKASDENSTGWSGKIHTRERNGFHQVKK